MSEDLYARFSKLTGGRFAGFNLHTDEQIRDAYLSATARLGTMTGPEAAAQREELNQIFQTIGTEAGRKDYAAQRIESIVTKVNPVTETGPARGVFSRIGQRAQGIGQRAATGMRGVIERAKAILPRKAASPEGSGLEIAPAATADIPVPAAEMPVPDTAAAPSIDRAPRTLHTPAEREAIIARADAAMRPQNPIVARSAEEKAAIIAKADAAMRTGSGPIRRSAQELAANRAQVREGFKAEASWWSNAKGTLRNRAEALVQPVTERLATRDPYKIIGAKRGSAPEEVMAAYNAKLQQLSHKPLQSPAAQREMVRVQEAYEALYPRLLAGDTGLAPKVAAAAKSAATSRPAVTTGKAVTTPLRVGSAGFAHGGKLLVGGVVAAAAVGYLASRNAKAQETPLTGRADGQRWADATQPTMSSEIQR